MFIYSTSELYIHIHMKEEIYTKELFASSTAITKGVTGCPFNYTNNIYYESPSNKYPLQANNDYNSSYSYVVKVKYLYISLLTVNCY